MSQQRRIKFTHSGHSHLAGNFVSGDTFTGPAEICAHYVDEACCAEWDDADAPVQAPAEAAKPARKKRGAAAADDEAEA